MSSGVYLATAESPSAWPVPWEIAYQAQTRWGERVPGARRPDITYPERLLIASIVNLWDDRPHGMITWSAEAFRVSRETIYEIGRRWSPQRTLEQVAEPPPSITPPEDGPEHITSSHFARSVLTLRFPGGVTLRPMERCLEVILGQTRSPAWKQAAALLGSPFLMPIQKDVYHVLNRARQTLTDLERTALAKLAAAEKQATRHKSGMWIIRRGCFDTWKEAHARADAAIDRAQELRFWIDCLHDAFEVAELGTGAIRDVELAEWYLAENLLGLEAIDDRRVRGLAAYIRKQQPQLFTFYEWLAMGLVPWRRRACEHFGDAEVTELFERAVARSWRIQRAITNGQHCLHNAADRAEAEVASLGQNDPPAACLALELTALLEEVVRTSSASECLNSLSNHFLVTKRSFPERLNSQHFFNLIMLWHNLRRFERGKRKGKSPFEILGVRVFGPDGNETDDWMAALGYPEEACPAAAAA